MEVYFCMGSTAISPFHLMCATKLRQVVTREHKRSTAYSKKSWANEFRILEKELHGNTDQIETALDWYCEHPKEKGGPPILSGKGFRSMFDWLEQHMEKWNAKNRRITISQEAMKIVKRLKRKHWPKGSSEQLPQAVQVSITNYSQFLHAIKNHSPPSTEQRFHAYVLKKLTSPATFVETWFTDVNTIVANWAAWSGDLMYMVFKADSETFQQIGQGWAMDYCFQPLRWNNLVGEIIRED